MNEHSSLLRSIIFGTFAIRALFALLGVWLVYLAASGTNNIFIFGQRLQTNNTGVAALFLGAVTVVLLIRRVLKTLEMPLHREQDSLRATRAEASTQQRDVGSW